MFLTPRITMAQSAWLYVSTRVVYSLCFTTFLNAQLCSVHFPWIGVECSLSTSQPSTPLNILSYFPLLPIPLDSRMHLFPLTLHLVAPDWSGLRSRTNACPLSRATSAHHALRLSRLTPVSCTIVIAALCMDRTVDD